MSLRALGRLLRLSLAASAVADIAAGIVLGAGSWPGGAAPWLLVAGSLCVYHGGMALNDWADRVRDAVHRPARPIPAGAVPATTAGAVGLGLFALGVAVAWRASPPAGLVLSAVAASALAYDLGPRGPWLGPVLLGLCRAGNLTAGLLLGAPNAHGVLMLFPLAYGLFVVVVSRLGRLEDEEDRLAPDSPRPRRLLLVAGALLLVPGFLSLAATAPEPLGTTDTVLGQVSPFLAIAVGAAGALGLVRVALGTRSWAPATVVQAMGMALRRLLVFTAASAIAVPTVESTVVGALILLGVPLSYGLRRIFPPS